ncbi:hypothetical protein AgCh_031206 [Apium graveolens]
MAQELFRGYDRGMGASMCALKIDLFELLIREGRYLVGLPIYILGIQDIPKRRVALLVVQVYSYHRDSEKKGCSSCGSSLFVSSGGRVMLRRMTKDSLAL